MPTTYPLSRDEHLYAVVETTYGIVPSIGATNAFRYNLAEMVNVREIIQPGYKTGTRSLFTFVKGRRSANINVTMDLFASGAAGTKPDADPLFQSLFGVAPTVVGGTSVTYNLADTPLVSISLFKYHQAGTTFNHKIAHGVVITDAEFAIGQNIAYARLGGRGLSVLEKDYFSSADATEKGGLASFPAEPASPVYNGSSITGFTGQITLDGTIIAIDLQQAAIRIRSGNALVDSAFNNYYPVGAEGDVRNVTISFTMWENDSAIMQTLRNKALSQTPIPAIFQVGTVAGNIYTFTVPNLVLSQPTIQEQRRLILNFADCLCLSSTQALKDEIIMATT